VATEDDAEYKISVAWKYSPYHRKHMWAATVYHRENLDDWGYDERGRPFKRVGMGWAQKQDFEGKVKSLVTMEAELYVRKLKSEAIQYENNVGRGETRYYR
jgi:hypothetical protein